MTVHEKKISHLKTYFLSERRQKKNPAGKFGKKFTLPFNLGHFKHDRGVAAAPSYTITSKSSEKELR